ncbi:7-cyano-7-deazaguanine synthase [Rhizobium sp. RU36D]|uniref:7-cyano-7-deazaguanine synthase n=1 Tax=Rhizobium sp. RU36D TaxID=1907415 RepID=UPI000A05D717|nr:7-cyano-7-deazaguanine synthase [Rhizobium sp. RU36D]
MRESILLERPTFALDVVASSERRRKDVQACIIGRDIRFKTAALESFASRNWNNVVFDALVVAAAVEFCDRALARRAVIWGREFNVLIAVHDADLWSSSKVYEPLIAGLELLTGDRWKIEFVTRISPAESPRQIVMEFPRNAEAVIAYSDGMDSRAVAGLERATRGDKLVLVRLGGSGTRLTKAERAARPFTAVPYEVELGRDNGENSARSRGFKFAMIAAIGAFLVNAPVVIVPESGQGALGPALLPVGQGYPDYRNHPAFTARMEALSRALLGHAVRYEFPRIWNTKGETLAAFARLGSDDVKWMDTRSCWQQARHVSVDGHFRQCGICAACLLRRLSVHAAGLSEPASTYVWENLGAAVFEEGANPNFKKITRALRQYAIAGVMHFDHMAGLRKSPEYTLVKSRFVHGLAPGLREEAPVVAGKLDQLLTRHEEEWSAFIDSIGAQSFLNAWISSRP